MEAQYWLVTGYAGSVHEKHNGKCSCLQDIWSVDSPARQVNH